MKMNVPGALGFVCFLLGNEASAAQNEADISALLQDRFGLLPQPERVHSLSLHAFGSESLYKWGVKDNSSSWPISMQSLSDFSVGDDPSALGSVPEPVYNELRLRLVQTLASAGSSRQGAPVWLIVVVVILAIVLVLVLAMALLIWRRRDFRRMVRFWWNFGHIIMAYRKAQRQALEPYEQEEILAAMHEVYAPKILEGIVAMGGIFIKLGQLLSLQPDVPDVIREQLNMLHDNCKPMESKELGKLIEAELRQTEYWRCGHFDAGESAVKQVFSRFDMRPIGVASIGQVHRARLRESSEELVVKVQFPEARGLCDADLSCLKNAIDVVKGTQHWIYIAVCEIERQLAQECDYRREAANIDTMKAVLLPTFADSVCLPEVRHDLTNDTILATSFMEGQRLDQALRKKLADVGLSEVAKVLRIVSGNEEASPELLVGTNGSCSSDEAQVHDSTKMPIEPTKETLAVADCQRIIHTLFDVWGYSIVRAGTFNADPHPGNILLMPDGKLGLVDFGQVKNLSAGVRGAMACTLLGLLRADVAGTAAALRDLGVYANLEDGDSRMWYHASQVFERRGFLPNLDESWGKQGGHAGDMVLVVRALVLLKGMALGLGFPVSVAEAWGKWAATTPTVEEEVETLIKEIQSSPVSGTYDLTLDDDTADKERPTVGTLVLQHTPGSLWFSGSWLFTASFGVRNEGKIDPGFLCGRSIEFRAGNQIVRGIVRDQGDSITNIRVTDTDTLEVTRHNATRTSGSMGRAFDTMKAEAAAAMWHFKPSLTKSAQAKFVQSVMKSAQTLEHSPEG